MIKDKVLNIIKDTTHRVPKKMSFTLDTLDVDSMDLTEIVLKIENEFGVRFTDEECFQIRYWSINKIIENIEKKIND